MMSCLILHTNSGARAALRVERLRRSIALSCALNQIYLPDRVLLRFNSRESVDWLIPTIRATSFLGHFLWSKAKICDLCSEVSCLYIRNTEIINLRESSKGDSFLYCRYRSSGLRAPAARPTRGVFHRLEPMKKRMICCTSILKVRAPKCCPKCGHPHLVKNCFRTRDFISLPIGGKKVILRMKVRRYKCKCVDCDYDCQERISFVPGCHSYTRRFAR